MKHNAPKHVRQNCKQVVMCLQLSEYLNKNCYTFCDQFLRWIKAAQQSFFVLLSKLKSIEITFINITFTKIVMVFLFIHFQDGNLIFTSVE